MRQLMNTLFRAPIYPSSKEFRDPSTLFRIVEDRLAAEGYSFDPELNRGPYTPRLIYTRKSITGCEERAIIIENEGSGGVTPANTVFWQVFWPEFYGDEPRTVKVETVGDFIQRSPNPLLIFKSRFKDALQAH